MKRIVLAMLLVAAVTAVAQTAAAPAQSAPAPAQGAPAPATQKKEIKDPAEYNAYVGAIEQKDVAAKISGLEAFLTQYPNSIMKADALEILMGSYEQAGNAAKMQDTAQKVLQANPCNLRALALVTYSKQQTKDLPGAGQNAERGLGCIQTATKPADVSDADWQKLKTTTAGIFNNAGGMAAYAAKDYGKAEQFLGAAVTADPTNLTEIYYLGLADLAPGPAEKDVEGLFYIARAADLQADANGKAQISEFGRKKYKNYHGSDDGWKDVLAAASTATSPPPDLATKVTKYVPPTPAEQCADIMKTKKIEEMSFAEWQLCLTNGAPADVDKIWSTLKGKPLQMVAHIISIDNTGKATKLQLAGSEDDIEAKKADIDLTMTATIPKKDMPKEDTDFQFQGTPTAYTPSPFIMTMEDGALLVKSAPKKPTPARRKPAAQ